ncbi:MAG TPA: hypothetical protein ENI23_11250 [bacterium]|nr:hypothetical protein [bacterium]
MAGIESVSGNKNQPLPTAKEEINRFKGEFANLKQEQITKILEIVINETKKSREFGLFLSSDLLVREESFFLNILNKLGGIEQITKDMEFEETIKIISEASQEEFAQELQNYFDLFKNRDEAGSNLRYSIHLEAISSSILQKVYSDFL